MKKQNFSSFFFGLFLFLFWLPSTQPILATMCGADNSGSCQISCTSGQTSIADPTEKCTGAFNGSGGTLCCSPANIQEYPASQCTAMGGSNASNADDCSMMGSGWYAAGKYLRADCSDGGYCCVPGGTTYQAAQACNAPNCEGSTSGATCRIACQGGETPSTAGICPSGKTCCIPGGGGTCQDKGGVCISGLCSSDNREVNSAGGACVGADATKSCCSSTQNSGPNVGRLNYTLLESIPGQDGTSGDFSLYLQKLYNFTFWAIGVAALFMLTVGGFMYVTAAGNTSRISTAKTIITDSLLGIVVALFAWLFLYVINPDLVESLTLPNTAATPVPGGGEGEGGPAPADARTAAQTILAGGAGITLNGSGSCATASGTAVSPQYTLEQIANGQPVIRCMNGCPSKGACSQTTSINTQMLVAMIEVARTYPFTVTSITGGSHCEAGVSGCKGLSSHYAGNAIDITTPNKSSWPAIVSAFRQAGSDNGQTFCDYNGTPLPSTRCNEANHIHVAF